MESQQPLGLVLSFYKVKPKKRKTKKPGGSTAAWACIEFLLRQMVEKIATSGVSQQPLGLVLSFYATGAFGRLS